MDGVGEVQMLEWEGVRDRGDASKGAKERNEYSGLGPEDRGKLGDFIGRIGGSKSDKESSPGISRVKRGHIFLSVLGEGSRRVCESTEETGRNRIKAVQKKGEGKVS